MKTPQHPIPLEFPSLRNPLHAVLLAVAGTLFISSASGCATGTSGPPTTHELLTKGGTQKTVLLLRVTTEVDGEAGPAFRSLYPDDDIWLGIADFSTGLELEPTTLRFLSDTTRREGWTYLLLDPGLHYIGAHEPRSGNAFAHNARWHTCPRWSIDIPNGARILYGGTLFLPGEGRIIFFGPRMLVSFDETRLEVRNESIAAETISNQWFPDLLPMSVQLLQRQMPGDTLIIDTPAGE